MLKKKEKEKKIKTPKKSTLIKKLDDIFSLYIRLRDSFVKWWERYIQCPLCWKIVPIKQAQNMHFIKRSNKKYRYREDNCFAGCYRCNVILSWNYIVYTRFMQRKFGIEYVDRMINDKILSDIPVAKYLEMIDLYKEKVDFILNWK